MAGQGLVLSVLDRPADFKQEHERQASATVCALAGPGSLPDSACCGLGCVLNTSGLIPSYQLSCMMGCCSAPDLESRMERATCWGFASIDSCGPSLTQTWDKHLIESLTSPSPWHHSTCSEREICAFEPPLAPGPFSQSSAWPAATFSSPRACRRLLRVRLGNTSNPP